MLKPAANPLTCSNVVTSAELKLNDNRLIGTLPSDISLLSERLTSLQVQWIFLSGLVPSKCANYVLWISAEVVNNRKLRHRELTGAASVQNNSHRRATLKWPTCLFGNHSSGEHWHFVWIILRTLQWRDSISFYRLMLSSTTVSGRTTLRMDSWGCQKSGVYVN